MEFSRRTPAKWPQTRVQPSRLPAVRIRDAAIRTGIPAAAGAAVAFLLIPWVW
jgi:hypothetical protein